MTVFLRLNKYVSLPIKRVLTQGSTCLCISKKGKNKHIKKYISLFLSLILSLSFVTNVLAVSNEEGNDTIQEESENLQEMKDFVHEYSG